MKKNSMNFKMINKPGFTVLEFLVVIAIMAILIGLVLVGLSRFRSNAADQEKISALQNIIIGLEQYNDICGEYPKSLDYQESCNELAKFNKNLGSLLPEIVPPRTVPSVQYVALDISGIGLCTGFHAAVKLDRTVDGLGIADADKNSTSVGVCGSTSGFDGTESLLLDIAKGF